METKSVTPFVEDFEDFEDLKPSASPKAAETAAAPAPAPSNPAPVQQSGPTPALAQPTQPVTTASAEPAPTPAAAKQGGDDYDVEFGDENLMSRSDGLDRLRPEKGKTVRFALLTNYIPAKRAFNHYIEKKGTYHCLTPRDAKTGVATGELAACCVKLEESQPQIVALVLHYTNANPKTGRYEKDGGGQFPPIQWEIKFVRLSRSAFRRVSGLTEEDGQPTDIDITMSHRDSGIGYEYNKVSLARWKRNPELVKEVETAVKAFADGKKLLSKLGKKVSALEFRAILAGTKPSDEADLSQIDDI